MRVMSAHPRHTRFSLMPTPPQYYPVSLKTLKKKVIHDYDSIMKGVERQIRNELSAENVELIFKYDMEMVRQSIAIATRQKHLKTLLSLTRLLQKDWKDVKKNDIEQLVYNIMQRYSDESGKETNYSYDHKKILKIFFRWMNNFTWKFFH